MSDHDLLWKSLLGAFLPEFLEFVVPSVLDTHKAHQASFLEQEAIADPPKGRISRLDVIARVPPIDPARESSRLLMIHVEIERDYRVKTAWRMWRYYRQLRLKYEDPVLPIVLFLRGGPRGVERITLREHGAGFEVSAFTFWALGLSKIEARDHLEKNALAPALASCMGSKVWSHAERKLRCLERIFDLDVDEARRLMLFDAVETYVTLKVKQKMSYAEMVEKSARRKEIEVMELTWSGRLQYNARLEGLEKGRLEGIRLVLKSLLRQRFGSVPPDSLKRLDSIDDSAVLERIGARILEAES
ncbi:MAG: hypothetical protein AAF725_09255, partial [Acidobacteriota bacterium]